MCGGTLIAKRLANGAIRITLHKVAKNKIPYFNQIVCLKSNCVHGPIWIEYTHRDTHTHNFFEIQYYSYRK